MWNLPFVVLGIRRKGTLTAPDSQDRSFTWAHKRGLLNIRDMYDTCRDHWIRVIFYFYFNSRVLLAFQSTTHFNFWWHWHVLEQTGDCLKEGIDLLPPALTKDNLFQQLIHLLLERRQHVIWDMFSFARALLLRFHHSVSPAFWGGCSGTEFQPLSAGSAPLQLEVCIDHFEKVSPGDRPPPQVWASWL